MAKAVAECTCRVCGFKFEVYATKRNRREADNWAEWAVTHYDLCESCALEQHKAAAAALAVEAKEMGLPELKGSEKQVVWAEQIRADMLTNIDQVYKVRCPNPSREEEDFFNCLYKVLTNKDKASFWISNRDCSGWNLLTSGDITAEAKELMKESSVVAKEVKKEATLAPEEVSHALVVVTVTSSLVSAKTINDADFRAIAKNLNFQWNKEGVRWEKPITNFTGSAVERAAELINHLLRAGFPVECFDQEAREKAVKADFKPECHRWIKLVSGGKYDGMLSIYIPFDNDRKSIYEAAKAISRHVIYREGRLLAPVHLGDLVEDFASIHGYQISDAAREAIEGYKKKIETADRVEEVQIPNQEMHMDKLQEILFSSSEIISDLIDQ